MSNQVDSIISRILNLRETISSLEAEAEELRVEKATLENNLMEQMANMGVTQIGSTLGTASMKTATKWAISDWDSLLKYIIETESFDMLQKRISTKAVGDRMAVEEEVPGIQGVQIFTLSIRKK